MTQGCTQTPPPSPASRHRRFPRRWRKATWALAIFNLLVLIWLISAIVGVGNNCAGLTGSELSACQAGTGTGAGTGITTVVAVWFFGCVVLSLVWLVSRPRRRQCPQCGVDVEQRLTVCRACGFDFTQATAQNPWPPTLLP